MNFSTPYRILDVALVRNSYFFTFYFLAVVGVLSVYEYNYFPASVIFELLFFGSCLVLMISRNTSAFFIGIVALVYVVVSGFYSIFLIRNHPFDFLQAYKAFIYIFPLSIYLGRKIFKIKEIVYFLKVLLILFAVKYGYSIVIDVNPRMGDRPAIFVENNFELIFLITLFYIFRNFLGEKSFFWLIFLFSIVVVSGSRSALLATLIAFGGIFFNKFNIRFVLYLLFYSLMIFIIVKIFHERNPYGITTIDRFNFMLVFLYETSEWPLWKYFFGAGRITPLSDESCRSLIFYEGLFSFSGDGSCFSVILHSYLLRVIFDHGILGLMFLFYFIFFGMRYVGYSVKESVVVIGIFATSALSVSAMNSIFVAMTLAIIFSTYNRAND